MWRCDVLTGELVKVKLNKETKIMHTGKTKRNGEPHKQLTTIYFIESKPNYFYLYARSAEDAKTNFEGHFNKLDQRLAERKAIQEQQKEGEK